MNSKRKELYSKFSCQPYWQYIGLGLQFTTFITLSFAVRDLAALKLPFIDSRSIPEEGMTTEGILWFQDLTVADPTLITPIAIGVLHFLNISVHEPSLMLDNTSV